MSPRKSEKTRDKRTNYRHTPSRRGRDSLGPRTEVLDRVEDGTTLRGAARLETGTATKRKDLLQWENTHARAHACQVPNKHLITRCKRTKHKLEQKSNNSTWDVVYKLFNAGSTVYRSFLHSSNFFHIHF